jgi:hypothetical protein
MAGLWHAMMQPHVALSVGTAFVHFVQFCVSLGLIPQCEKSVKKVFRTAYTYVSRDNITPQREVVGELNPAAMVCAFWFLSAAFQAGQVWMLLRKNYMKAKLDELNAQEPDPETFENMVSLRYVEYSVSASVMFMAMGILIGLDDLSTVCLLFVSMFATNVLGLASHQALHASGRPMAWILHLCGWVTFGVPFALMCESIDRTNRLSKLDVRMILSIVLVGACMAVFGFLQLAQLLWRWTNRTVGMLYDVLSLVAKTVLGWLLLTLMTDGVI